MAEEVAKKNSGTKMIGEIVLEIGDLFKAYREATDEPELKEEEIEEIESSGTQPLKASG